MFNLARDELRVLELFGQGLTEVEIADQLGMPLGQYKRLWQGLADKIDWHEAHTLEEMEHALIFERARTATVLAQLNASESRLNALMDLSPNGIVVVEGRTGRILQANRRSAEIFGYSVGELLDLEVEQLVGEAVRELHVKQRIGFLRSIRKREIGYHPPIFAVKKDGTTVELVIGLIATTTTDDVMVICREHALGATGGAPLNQRDFNR